MCVSLFGCVSLSVFFSESELLNISVCVFVCIWLVEWQSLSEFEREGLDVGVCLCVCVSVCMCLFLCFLF